jgi:hypothetical protein
MDTMHNLQRDLRDIKQDLRELKTITLDVQNRYVDHWSRVDKRMSFLQDLRQAMTNNNKGKSQARRVYNGPRLGLGL